jgi:peptide/nickel transport system permease protein
MLRFLCKKLVVLLISLGLLSVILFVLLRILPGDTAQIIAGTDASPEQVARIRETLGLNVSAFEQYWNWLLNFITGNLGTSAVTGIPIQSELLAKASITLPLCLMALAIALIFSIPLGTLRGMAPNSKILKAVDSFFQTLSFTPALWLGLLFLLLFARGFGILGIFPSSGMGIHDLPSLLSALFIPALCVALVVAPRIFRIQRVMVEDVSRAEFVRFGAALGNTKRRALIRYGLPAAIMPTISTVALTFSQMFTGVVVIEKLFVLPGIGSMVLLDLSQRDIIKVQTEIMMLTAIILSLGVIVDLIGAWIDPRLRNFQFLPDQT